LPSTSGGSFPEKREPLSLPKKHAVPDRYPLPQNYFFAFPEKICGTGPRLV
jgi:hypothetical protein